MFEKIKQKFMKPKTLQERYVKFIEETQKLSKIYGLDLIATLSVKDLLAQPTPTEGSVNAPKPAQELPKIKKGGKKSGK